jgi:serine/threonine-protein kinase RsbW
MVVSITAAIPEITRLAECVDSFGRDHRISSNAVNDMNVALDEIVSNIVHHGGETARAHPIVIRIGLDGDRFFVEVRDQGMPFDPVAHVIPAPRADARRVPGNLGLLFVRALMNEVRYAREDHSNVLFLAKITSGPGPEPAPPFEVEASRPDAQSAVVALRGMLVGTTHTKLRERLGALIDSGTHNIVVDLAETARISSSGFWVLFATRRRLEELHGRLVLCSPQPVVRTLFEIAGLLGEFTFAPDRAAALQALRQPVDPPRHPSAS